MLNSLPNDLRGSQPPGMDRSPSSAETVRFGDASITVRRRQDGDACFLVQQGAETVARSCLRHLGPTEIGYAATSSAVGGVAGDEVHAVIVRVMRRGTIWAQLAHGAFYAQLPPGRPARAVVKVLRDASRHSFAVARPR